MAKVLWESKNGKHIITDIVSKENEHTVYTTYLTHNIENHLVLNDNLEVLKFTGTMSKLPKMVLTAAQELVRQRTVYETAATTVLEEVRTNPRTFAGLVHIANDFLEKEFDMRLEIPIRRNNRLKRALGRFLWKSGKSYEIQLSGDLLTYHNDETIIDVLKHELVHYALFEQGLPHRDGQPTFENTLKRLGVSRTGVIKSKGIRNIYECAECGKVVAKTSRKLSNNGKYHRSNCCNGRINYKGQREV